MVNLKRFGRNTLSSGCFFWAGFCLCAFEHFFVFLFIYLFILFLVSFIMFGFLTYVFDLCDVFRFFVLFSALYSTTTTLFGN